MNQNCNINAKDKDGTPIIFNAFDIFDKALYETVKLMSELGADLDVKSVGGITFLNKNVQCNNLDIVKLILSKSIKQLDMMNNDGRYPLLIATENRNADMVRLLTEEFGANLNMKSKNGNPLIFSVLGEYDFKYDMAMLLIELGVDVNQKNSDGDVPLQLAVIAQKYDVTLAMLKKGASSNAKNKDGNYIMHTAYNTKNEEIIRLLVQFKANIDCKNVKGDTLLAKAVGVGSYQYNDYDYKMINLLLELGANPNIKNDKGESIIFKIIAQGKSETLNSFLDHNGEINVTNNDKKSPTQVAIDNKMPEILESLFKHGA